MTFDRLSHDKTYPPGDKLPYEVWERYAQASLMQSRARRREPNRLTRQQVLQFTLVVSLIVVFLIALRLAQGAPIL